LFLDREASYFVSTDVIYLVDSFPPWQGHIESMLSSLNYYILSMNIIKTFMAYHFIKPLIKRLCFLPTSITVHFALQI